ncbi:MAG: hypothetical protein ACOYWZ_10100 [Bacillota bacterium]
MAVPILFNAINTVHMNTSSMVAVGVNSQPGWSSHQKRNFGLGTPVGINWSFIGASTLIDVDVSDMPVNNPTGNISPQSQAI